jgi:pre-mRNA cleavage complex 2 protein Pcf11
MSFEQQFSSLLRDLTFNSKPIITTLSTIAGENQEQAGLVVQIIERHLKQAKAKIPILYLIDSILKNEGKFLGL